jgi:hypothetical protein
VSSSANVDIPETEIFGATTPLDDVKKWQWDRMGAELNLGILKFKISRKFG